MIQALKDVRHRSHRSQEGAAMNREQDAILVLFVLALMLFAGKIVSHIQTPVPCINPYFSCTDYMRTYPLRINVLSSGAMTLPD